MHGIEYRGRMHATMAYDHQPWHDMFVVLDDGAESGKLKFLGLWCHRQKSGGWFTLTESPDIDVTISDSCEGLKGRSCTGEKSDLYFKEA